MTAQAQGKKNTVPNDNRINLYIKDNNSIGINQNPGIIISTHYQSFNNGLQTMTSREISQLTGNPHNDLMKPIQYTQPRITGKGQLYFASKLLKEFKPEIND